MSRLTGVKAIMSGLLTTAAVAAPPTRLIAVSGDTPEVISWGHPLAGDWARVTSSPPGESRTYRGAVSDTAGNLYISSYATSTDMARIEKFAAESGVFLGEIVALPGIDRLEELALTPAGHLLAIASGSGAESIRRYGPDGALLGTPLPATEFGIRCVRVGPDGRAYASMNLGSDHRIEIFDPVSGSSAGSIQLPGSSNIGDFDFGPDGNIYGHRFQGDQTIYRVAPVAGAIAETAFLSGLNSVTALKAGPDGRLYVGTFGSVYSVAIDGAGRVEYATGPGSWRSLGELTFGTVIPAPATVTLLGLCGAFAMRRRR